MRGCQALALALCVAAIVGCSHGVERRAASEEAVREAVERQFEVSDARLDRAQLGLRVRDMILARRYAELDALADSLRTTDARFRSGSSMVSSFYGRPFDNYDESPIPPETWERLLHNLREWRSNARMHSPTPAIALAHALIDRAWAARGGGYANTVKEKQWDRFHNDITEARQILGRVERNGRSCPGWHEAMLEVALCLGASAEEYDRIFEAAVAAFPTHAEFYMAKSRYLQPRWHGEPGDWERFAAEVADRNPGGRGAELYARIVYSQADYFTNVFEESPAVSWERVQAGLEAWQARCPESVLPLSLSSRFAAQAGRYAESLKAHRALGKRVDLAAWDSDVTYWQRSRNWVLANSGRATATSGPARTR